MGGFSRFRKENNPHSNATKTVTATESEQVDDSERTSPSCSNAVADASIQDPILSNDHHQEESNSAEETGHDSSLSINVSEQPHDDHSQRDITFDSMMEHQPQESHFDNINDSIMDICDLNFANFENDDSILPYSNGDDEFLHEFQNDGDQEKEQVSQTRSSNQKSSSGGLNLFRHRKKPLPHVEGGKDHETNVTVEEETAVAAEEETDTLHGEKEQDDSNVKSISNDGESHEDVCQTSSDEPFAVDESRISSESQENTDQKSTSPQVTRELDNNNDMDQVETEKEMETIDVVMGSSLDDVKSVSDDYKSSSNPTEESNGIDGDAMVDRNTVSVTNDWSVSTTCKDAVSTTCVDEVTIGTPHVGMPEPPSSVSRKSDDISKKSESTSATARVVSLEGTTNTKPFDRISASTQRVLPMPPAPRNASNTSSKISTEQRRQMEPTMPAPISRNIADVSRTEQRPYVSRAIVPDSASKSLPRIIPRMNQTPIRPRTTTATTTGNSTNSMTNLNCGNEVREGGMNPITPSPGSNWNHDKSREKNITPESRTGLAVAPNRSISQINQISNSSVDGNQKISSHNEKEAKFDAYKDKFEKDIVESNDAWDRSDAELIELNLGLVMMDNMALRLHGKYGELLEDIEELLVS